MYYTRVCVYVYVCTLSRVILYIHTPVAYKKRYFTIVYTLHGVKRSYLNTTGGRKNRNRFAQSRSNVV